MTPGLMTRLLRDYPLSTVYGLGLLLWLVLTVGWWR